MTQKDLTKLTGSLKNNAGMIRVFRNNADGTVSEVRRTFRVSDVQKFLKSKSARLYSVEQKQERVEA